MEEEEAPNLPLDIIYQIPKYISDPASLARAASSCKLWRGVIKDRAFLDGLKTRHLDHGFTSSLLLGFFYQDSAEAPEHLWQHHKDKTRCMAPSFTPTSELLPFTGRREGYNSARPLSLVPLFWVLVQASIFMSLLHPRTASWSSAVTQKTLKAIAGQILYASAILSPVKCFVCLTFHTNHQTTMPCLSPTITA